MKPTRELARGPLWTVSTESLSVDDRYKVSHERCKSLLKAYDLTSADILNVSPKFWQLTSDPILAKDGAVGTLLAIHLNLCLGTLAAHESRRPDIKILVDKLLRYELCGQHCLTEVGHGLDVMNMETTATMLPSGEFELHTPTNNAAKYMPPTSPCGTPILAVVFARLMVNGTDRGVRPFVVHLNDGFKMCDNIFCKILPPRGGSRPVKHVITYFNRVRLPATALLGTMGEEGDGTRAVFYKNINRVVIGSLSMGAMGVTAMRVATYIAASYSLRRKVSDGPNGLQRAIITFSTQHIPILTAMAQSLVLMKFSEAARTLFVQLEGGFFTPQHFIAAVFKATAMRFALSIPMVLGDRCGAQGLFEANQMSALHADMRGAAIAEGDILALSIKFSIEMLLGRISPPETQDPKSLLYRREASLLTELREIVATAPNPRDPALERAILPHCQPLLESIGHRMAYDTAVASGMDKRLIDLFVASIMKLDPAWFSENGGISRAQQYKLEQEYAWELLPDIKDLMAELEVEGYVNAPIVSDERWEAFVESLETVGQQRFDHLPVKSHL
ncbi:hypothetical protein PM082_020011 [Marasmius tenuissimus]|nr:hypothetical protein PM082_020011 [Marasmius tenuissimus]